MAQVYLSQFSRRATLADTASYVVGGNTPAPLDTYIQYNRQGKFGAEIHFRYIYPIHSFQHGNNTNALGYWSHAEGAHSYTGLPNAYSSSILSSSVTLSAEYGNVTSSFRIGDYIYLNDYEFDNIYGTTIAKISNTSWDNTSSYVILDIKNIHSTKSSVGSLGSYYIQNLLGNQIARPYAVHSEGGGTYAIGIGAHSEGSGSYAVGKYSHTEGNNTVALGDYQTIVGQYNIFNTTQSAFIIGDGYAEIIDSGTFGDDPTTGSFIFNINATYTPIESLIGSIITVVSASSSISETFIIDDALDLGLGEYEITVNRPLTQNYYENVDTYFITKINRHNLLFTSQSWFEVSASNVFLQGIPSSSTAPQILVYDDLTGQVYYTASAAFGGVGVSPGGPNNSIQYNANGNFGGSSSFTFNGIDAVQLTGSMYISGAISASLGSNIVGFYGTASWAVSASNAFQAVSASHSPNFANTDLVFTNNRSHDTNGYWYFIYSDLIGGTLVSGGYQYFDNDSNSIGVAGGTLDTYTYVEITTQSIDLSFNGNPGVPSVYSFTNTTASFSSSITVTGSVYFPGLISSSYPSVVVIDTASGQLYYTTSSVGGAAVLLENLTTNITVGGSDSGTLYTAGTLLETILRDILTDYFDPTLTLNYLKNGSTQTYPADTGTYVEVSRSISFNTASFTSLADNPGGNYPYSASFTASGATIGNFNYYFGNNVVTADNNLGVGSIRTINRSTPNIVTFTINGVHPSSSALPIITDNATLTYVYPIYYGMSTFDYSKTSSNLNANPDLTKGVVAQESTQDILLNDTSKFIYFAFPSGWGDLTSIRDLATTFEYLGSSPAFISYSMANQSGSATTPWANQTYTVYQYYRNYPNGTDVNSKTYRFTF
jgi:hypothetical protein